MSQEDKWIRLQVKGQSGFNFVLPANPKWLVSEMHKQLISIYKQLNCIEEEEKKVLKVKSLKRNGFFVASSLKVGHAFNDWDQVSCTFIEQPEQQQIKKAQATQDKIARIAQQQKATKKTKAAEQENKKNEKKEKKEQKVLDSSKIAKISEQNEKKTITNSSLNNKVLQILNSEDFKIEKNEDSKQQKKQQSRQPDKKQVGKKSKVIIKSDSE